MNGERDRFGGVLRELTLVGEAVRSARRQAADGISPGPQLALALAAGERAQGELVELLVQALRPVGPGCRGDRRKSAGLSGCRGRRASGQWSCRG